MKLRPIAIASVEPPRHERIQALANRRVRIACFVEDTLARRFQQRARRRDRCGDERVFQMNWLDEKLTKRRRRVPARSANADDGFPFVGPRGLNRRQCADRRDFHRCPDRARFHFAPPLQNTSLRSKGLRGPAAVDFGPPRRDAGLTVADGNPSLAL